LQVNNPKITIGLIVYTGCEKYLPHSLPSLFNQDYPNIEFLLRDQSPNAEIVSWLKRNMPEVINNPKIKITTGENRMHSGGHNALINQMTGDYYFCVSNDMLYPRDFASKIVAELEKTENQGYGTATCKLMQWDFENKSKTNRIDSMGIGAKKTHHFFDIGQGEEDKGQYDSVKPFGSSGALTVFTKKALDEIAYQNPEGKTEYYDEFLHYKNDVDLAYRLQWAGQKCLLIPSVKVYHDRQVSGKDGIIGGRKEKKRWTKDSSVFGHQVVLLKNYTSEFSWSVRLQTTFYNLAKWGFLLIKEPYLLNQYKAAKKHMSEIEAKKKAMKRAVKPGEIEEMMK